MEYLVQVLQSQGGDKLLSFTDEFKSLPDAKRVSINDIDKELKGLEVCNGIISTILLYSNLFAKSIPVCRTLSILL